jgi:hypothetical protein
MEHLIHGQNIECPYHAYILQEPLTATDTSANTMERFMIHHPGEHYALFTRPDNKKINLPRMHMLVHEGRMEHKFAVEETGFSGFQVGL